MKIKTHLIQVLVGQDRTYQPPPPLMPDAASVLQARQTVLLSLNEDSFRANTDVLQARQTVLLRLNEDSFRANTDVLQARQTILQQLEPPIKMGTQVSTHLLQVLVGSPPAPDVKARVTEVGSMAAQPLSLPDPTVDASDGAVSQLANIALTDADYPAPGTPQSWVNADYVVHLTAQPYLTPDPNQPASGVHGDQVSQQTAQLVELPDPTIAVSYALANHVFMQAATGLTMFDPTVDQSHAHLDLVGLMAIHSASYGPTWVDAVASMAATGLTMFDPTVDQSYARTSWLYMQAPQADIGLPDPSVPQSYARTSWLYMQVPLADTSLPDPSVPVSADRVSAAAVMAAQPEVMKDPSTIKPDWRSSQLVEIAACEITSYPDKDIDQSLGRLYQYSTTIAQGNTMIDPNIPQSDADVSRVFTLIVQADPHFGLGTRRRALVNVGHAPRA